MPKAKRIDVHSHVLPREMLEAIRQRLRDYQMRILGLNALQLLGER